MGGCGGRFREGGGLISVVVGGVGRNGGVEVGGVSVDREGGGALRGVCVWWVWCW